MQVNLMVKMMPAPANTQPSNKVQENEKPFEKVFKEERTKENNREESNKTKDVKEEVIKEDDKEVMDNRKIKDEIKKEPDEIQKDKKEKVSEKDEKKDCTEQDEEAKKEEIRLKRKLMELAKIFGIEPGKIAQFLESKEFNNTEDSAEKINLLIERFSSFLKETDANKANLSEDISKIFAEVFNGAQDNNPAPDSQGTSTVQAAGQNETGQVQTQEEDSEEVKTEDVNLIQNSTTEEKSEAVDENVETEEAAAALSNNQDSTKKVNVDKKDNKATDAKAEVPALQENEESKDNKTKGDNKGEDNTEKQSSSTEKVSIKVKYQEKPDNVFRMPTEVVAQGIQNVQELTDVEKIQLKVQTFTKTQRDEIFNQIVEKASVTLTQDKAEMVLNLKPDHLGKLEMKIATEKGILAAQIMTENQQVKQIIESNFNVLRDALEKQGISVQSLSVSVGNQNWNRESNNGSLKNQNNNKQGQYKMKGITVSNSAYLRDSIGLNKLIWPDSTVNFTA